LLSQLPADTRTKDLPIVHADKARAIRVKDRFGKLGVLLDCFRLACLIS